MDFSEENRWIVKSARTIQGEIVDLGEEEWLESGPPPKGLLSSPSPLGAPGSTCARALVHLNIYPRNHHRVLVEAQWWVRVLRILGT